MKSNQEELRELLQFGFDTQDAINRSLADDGKITGGDFPNLFPLLRSAGPAFEDIGNPIKRWKDLTTEEREELKDWAIERFDLINDQVEFLIEDTLIFADDTIRKASQLRDRWERFVKSDSAA